MRRTQLWDRLRWNAFRLGTSRVVGRRPTLVLGDSHVAVFRGWHPPRRWIYVESVGGATASGIRNPNSATEALPRFAARLRRVKRFHDVIVCLGEVDCGYIVWRRAERTGLPIDDGLQETLDRYAAFLAQVRTAGPHRVYVMAAPLPTLPDDASAWGEIAKRRSDVTASQAERTVLTHSFNAGLRHICLENGMTFVDSSAAQVDPATGLVRQELLRHGEADHHLLDVPFRIIIADALAATT